MLLFLLKNLYSFTNVQDNVFVQMHCSIQYRVIKENADDAFYELQNPMEQIIQLMYLMHLPLSLARVKAHHRSPLTILARAVNGLHRDVDKGARSPPLRARRCCRRQGFATCRYAIRLVAGTHRRSRTLAAITTAAATLRNTAHRQSSPARQGREGKLRRTPPLRPHRQTFQCVGGERACSHGCFAHRERERSWCRFLFLLSTSEFVLAAALPFRYCSASPLLAKGKGEGWWWLPVVEAARNREGDETGTAAAWRTSRRRERHRGCPPSSPLLRCLATSRLRHGCHVTPPGRRDDTVAAPCSVKLPSTGEGRQGCRNLHCENGRGAGVDSCCCCPHRSSFLPLLCLAATALPRRYWRRGREKGGGGCRWLTPQETERGTRLEPPLHGERRGGESALEVVRHLRRCCVALLHQDSAMAVT
nr:hypersensitive-induced response protein 4-like [Ipomoea batatas]